MPTVLQDASARHSSSVIEMQTAVAVLTSWKDIAKYMGKGVRTVQRWESDLGLPVRRPARARKSAVFAIPGEIDEWVRSQQLMNGRTDTEQGEIAGLLLQIRELQAVNGDLRLQLQRMHARPA